jgi:DNA-binding beta-propeller fold protein YncE
MRITIVLAVCWLTVANAQWLESTVNLPDTLGPLNGPYHLAWDSDSAHPRLYIGGEGDSGGVIVAEAITCKRLARIPTGPVIALSFVPSHGKLYVAKAGRDSIVVVDCATNQIVSTIHTASIVSVMQYNSQNDRLYSGGDQISVIDCAADTVIHTIAVAATAFAFDSTRNKLYAGGNGPLTVIDCTTDSVVATVSRVDSAGALIYNPTAGKVYAVSGDTLFAVDAQGDTVVSVIYFWRLRPVLACDPDRNRVYCSDNHSGGWVEGIDCAGDTVVLRKRTGATASHVVCDVARNRLLLVYESLSPVVDVYDAAVGSLLWSVGVDGLPSGVSWCPGLDRLYCLPQRDTAHHYQSCLIASVDCAAESLAGIVPLTMCAGQLTVDTVHNRLYFVYQTVAAGCVGAVDCSRNVVTWYRSAGVWTTAICYNPNNDHLYWAACTDRSSNSVVVVFDCASGSVVKRIPIGGEIFSLKLHEGLNKLCVYSSGCDVSIVDCNRDTLVTQIPLAQDYRRPILLVPEDNRFWYLGTSDVVVVDLVGDTVVARVADNLMSIDDACACQKDRKIYTSKRQVIDMDNPAHVESTAAWGNRFLYDPRMSKLYVSGNYGSRSVFHVFDVRSDTLTATFYGPCTISGMCLGHTGNYIYCAGYPDSMMFVIDARGDSVLAAFRVPTTAADRDPLVANRRTNRIYEAHCGG